MVREKDGARKRRDDGGRQDDDTNMDEFMARQQKSANDAEEGSDDESGSEDGEADGVMVEFAELNIKGKEAAAPGSGKKPSKNSPGKSGDDDEEDPEVKAANL